MVFREFENSENAAAKFCIIFMDGMVDDDMINYGIVKQLMTRSIDTKFSQPDIVEGIITRLLVLNTVIKSSNIEQMLTACNYGDTLLLVDGCSEVAIVDTKGWEMRSIAEPESEKVVRGPREAFTESINVNLSLIRRRINSPDLKFQYKEIGTRTRTKVCVCYLESLANEKILEELNKRLNSIKIDAVIDSQSIEEFIKDCPLSTFQTMGNTERPDVVVGRLMEGRIAVICDGTPFALTLPYIFVEYFQANEDYYSNYFFASMTRIMRFIAFFLAASVAPLYVAFTTYHQELLPTRLILSISAARQGVPLPTIVEVIMMLFIFDLLREAGVRLPKPVGQSISIVGALILGEAAVTAKLVSAPMVIVTAMSGVSSFLLPQMAGSLTVIRTIFLLMSGMLGLYGFVFATSGLFIYLMSMRSFGVPYMLNSSPFNLEELKDTYIRAPWWIMYSRPRLIGSKNRSRKSQNKS